MTDEKKPGESPPLTPFVPAEDSANMAAVSAAARRRQQAGAAFIMDTGMVVGPHTIVQVGRKVQYVDFGFSSATEFWDEVVLPTYEKFRTDPTRANAIKACVFAWHIHDWVWHERHPGENTRNNNAYDQFLEDCLKACPELGWIRDAADASKHRGLGRSKVQVRELASGWPSNSNPLTISLACGTEHDLAGVLCGVMEFWQKEHFS